MLATVKTHWAHHVFDANGLEWKGIVWVDTETGEAEQVELPSRLNEAMTDVVRHRLTLAAPVLLVPMDKTQ